MKTLSYHINVFDASFDSSDHESVSMGMLVTKIRKVTRPSSGFHSMSFLHRNSEFTLTDHPTFQESFFLMLVGSQVYTTCILKQPLRKKLEGKFSEELQHICDLMMVRSVMIS